MNDEFDNLVPVGNRYIQKEVCNECQGKGYLTFIKSSKCPKCGGSGWDYGSDGEPVICEVCSGEKSVAVENKIKCKDCNSQGYRVLIMQDFEMDDSCEKCDGTGEVACDCVEMEYADIECNVCEGSGISDLAESIECSRCHGAGIDPTSEVEEFGITQWYKSKFSRQVHSQFGGDCFADMDEKDQILLDDGQSLSIVLCPRCGSSDNLDHCWLCNGNKVIKVRLHQNSPCLCCAGTGTVDSETCDKCSGFGVAGCEECLGTLIRECPDCHGSGTSKKIVSKNV